MLPPSASALLEVWEAGNGELPFRRALRLLQAACPEIEPNALIAMHVGRRDELLLRLRRMLFGTRIKCLVECPVCGDRLELEVEIDVLLTNAKTNDDDMFSCFTQVEDIKINFRQPATVDLEALAMMGKQSDPREYLLRRCVLQAQRGNIPLSFDELPAEVLDRLELEIADRAALADIHFDARCQMCEHRWEPVFDIGAYLWLEFDVWVRKLLHEVHLLASAYGWSEADIVSLSPLRRRSYLQMVGS
jgi:hypothetical protein